MVKDVLNCEIRETGNIPPEGAWVKSGAVSETASTPLRWSADILFKV
jgi:hypothetical protein